MIQIRNVPPDLHERLKQRAASKGMNLSDYLKSELDRIALIPTNAEIFARIQAEADAGLLPSIGSEEIVQGVRDDRDSH